MNRIKANTILAGLIAIVVMLVAAAFACLEPMNWFAVWQWWVLFGTVLTLLAMGITATLSWMYYDDMCADKLPENVRKLKDQGSRAS